MKRSTLLAVALAAVAAPALAAESGDTLIPNVDQTPSATISQAAADAFTATQYGDGQTLGIATSSLVDDDLVARSTFGTGTGPNLSTSNSGDTLGFNE